MLYPEAGKSIEFRGQTLRPPFDKAFTNSIVSVSDFSFPKHNVAVPKLFTVTTFMPLIRPTGEPVIKFNLAASVTNCELFSKREMFEPKLSAGENVSMADARFGNLYNAIHYSVTNGYQNAAQLRERPEFKEWSKHSPQYQYSFNSYRPFFYSAFAGVTLLSIVTLALVRNHIKRKERIK